MLRSPGRSRGAAVSSEPTQSQETQGDASTSTQEEQTLSAHTPTVEAARSVPGAVPKWLKLPGEEGCGVESPVRKICILEVFSSLTREELSA